MNSYIDTSYFDKLFDLFLSLKAELIPWVASIVMIRVLINLAMFKSVSDMGTIVKDVLFGMILLCFFVEIVKFSQLIPNMLHEKLASPEQVEVTFSDGKHGFWTLASYITVGAYWLAKLIYLLFIGILIVTGVFVIIAGTMLAQRYLLNIFFVGLFGASLMPVIWFAINEGMKSFARSDEGSLSNFFILLGGELLKLGIPIGGATALLKNPFVDSTTKAANIPLRGGKTALNAGLAPFHPQSKTVQFYKTLRGGAKNISRSDKMNNKQQSRFQSALITNSKPQSIAKGENRHFSDKNAKADRGGKLQRSQRCLNAGMLNSATNLISKEQKQTTSKASSGKNTNPSVQGFAKNRPTQNGKPIAAIERVESTAQAKQIATSKNNQSNFRISEKVAGLSNKTSQQAQGTKTHIEFRSENRGSMMSLPNDPKPIEVKPSAEEPV